MELAKKYCGMEMFSAAPLGLLLELFQFTVAACELTASDTINIKANLIIAEACPQYSQDLVHHDEAIRRCLGWVVGVCLKI